jgi:hypothetical protein
MILVTAVVVEVCFPCFRVLVWLGVKVYSQTGQKKIGLFISLSRENGKVYV